MNKQITDPIFSISHITIILGLLLMMGCVSEVEMMRREKERDQAKIISAPDLVNPISMSPKVGVNPNQKYQEVMKFSASNFDVSPGRSLENRVPNFLQGKMSEAVKDSERKAIKDIEIIIEDAYGFITVADGGRYTVQVKGLVIETQ